MQLFKLKKKQNKSWFPFGQYKSVYKICIIQVKKEAEDTNGTFKTHSKRSNNAIAVSVRVFWKHDNQV